MRRTKRFVPFVVLAVELKLVSVDPVSDDAFLGASSK